MLNQSTIAFVGSGAMAEAVISGLLAKNMATPGRLIASGPREERGRVLAEKYGVRWTTHNPEAVAEADIVVLGVKPQMLARVLPELHERIRPDALVLSIAAGVKVETLAQGLAHPNIVRSMPNTPAQIGEGITVWIAAPAVSEQQRAEARALLSALGQEVEADYEDQLDMATALSGTGPAYVYLFMEALVDAGVHLGFSRRVAEQLVTQTVKGSVDFYQHSPSHMARLRNQVTSPGGTTAEALYYLEKAGFRTAISRAIWAAYQRSVELGQGRARHDKLEG
ncbi:MAG TPA: pyrroline-5-carboxylate reductase [Anaerolineales bacterium]|nr:pyrroline-5-carboxylate reductase [Anaerolineales bacterium]